MVEKIFWMLIGLVGCVFFIHVALRYLFKDIKLSLGFLLFGFIVFYIVCNSLRLELDEIKIYLIYIFVGVCLVYLYIIIKGYSKYLKEDEKTTISNLKIKRIRLYAKENEQKLISLVLNKLEEKNITAHPKVYETFDLTMKEIYISNEEKIKYYEDIFNMEAEYISKYKTVEEPIMGLKNLFVYDIYERFNRNKLTFDGVLSNDIYFPLIKATEIKGINLESFLSRLVFLRKNMEIFLFENREEMLNNYKGIKVGCIGEARVNQELALYKDILVNIPNVRMEEEIEGRIESVEADNIIISNKGIFSLEVKNYGESNEDYTLQISKDGQWSKIVRGRETNIGSVSAQHGRHIGIQQRLFNQELSKRKDLQLPYINFEPIYVIANENVKIINDSNMIIVRPSLVYPYIANYKSDITIPKECLSIFEEIINSLKRPLKNYPIPDYKAFYDKYLDILFKAYIDLDKISEICLEYKEEYHKAVNEEFDHAKF